MATITQRVSHFRGINRSAQQNGLDVSYAYNAENVDIVGGKLTNKNIGSNRLVLNTDAPAARPFFLQTNNGDYLVIRDKYVDMGVGRLKTYSLLGDANCDGKVTAADAAMILQYVNGMIELSSEELANADVNFDGVVNETDSQLILSSISNGVPLTPNWDDANEEEVGPYEPDVGASTRSQQNVVNDTSLYIRGVCRSTVNARIDNTDCVIASGVLDTTSGGYYTHRGYLVDGATAKTAVYYLGSETTPKVHVRKFGSGTVLLYDRRFASVDQDSDGHIMALYMYMADTELTTKMRDRALLDGIFLFDSPIGNTLDEDDLDKAFMWLKVTGFSTWTYLGADSVVIYVETTHLASEVTTGADGTRVAIRGECSDMTLTYMQMYYGRLFAAGHRSNRAHPRRLYWSCLPGDGRTIEDFTQTEVSVDTSGGHVDIGDPTDGQIRGLIVCNNQLLIFTDYRLFRLYGTAPSNYRLELVGELEGFRISNPVEINGAVYWLALSGIQMYNGSYIQNADDDYSTRYLLNSFPRYMREAFDVASVHAVLFDNSIMFAFDNNRGMDDSCLVLRYELETGNVIRYVVPCDNYLQQFTDSMKTNFGVVDGKTVKNETRYFQALVHRTEDENNPGSYIYTMTMTQWYDWGNQPFGWYDGKTVHSVWESDWNDLRTPETVKRIHTAIMRGSGEFDFAVESETNKDEIHVTMPETRAKVKELTPHYAEGRSMKFAISSDREFEIEPYMTMIFEAGDKR